MDSNYGNVDNDIVARFVPSMNILVLENKEKIMDKVWIDLVVSNIFIQHGYYIKTILQQWSISIDVF